MPGDLVDFEVRAGAIDGLSIVTLRQFTDERGTIRELFRRSAFEAVGIPLAAFGQINVTESTRGALRGMHGEAMTKLLAVVEGDAFGAYVDLRPGSPTAGRVDTIVLRPGVQVLVPSGVANGFQTTSARSQYVYCFDQEWRPDMPGVSCNPLDPELGIDWPIPVDPDDPAQLSRKDRDAPSLADLGLDVTR